MANVTHADPPPLKPPDPPHGRSYASVVYASTPHASVVSFSGPNMSKVVSRVSIPRRQCVWKDGRPSIGFTTDEIKRSAEPLKYSLVAKFTGPRPAVDDVRAMIKSTWGVSEEIFIGVINSNHLLLRFIHEADFIKAWTRDVYAVKGVTFRVFPWTPSFKPGTESSLSSVWISLPLLPCNLFDIDFLASIISGAGRFLTVDHATLWKTRPGIARVCVEVDLMKPLPQEVEIVMGSRSIVQKLVYERVPSFCSSCLIRGHCLHKCPRKVVAEVSSSKDCAMVVPKDPVGVKVAMVLKPTGDGRVMGQKEILSTKQWVSKTFHAKLPKSFPKSAFRKPRVKWTVKKKSKKVVIRDDKNELLNADKLTEELSEPTIRRKELDKKGEDEATVTSVLGSEAGVVKSVENTAEVCLDSGINDVSASMLVDSQEPALQSEGEKGIHIGKVGHEDHGLCLIAKSHDSDVSSDTYLEDILDIQPLVAERIDQNEENLEMVVFEEGGSSEIQGALSIGFDDRMLSLGNFLGLSFGGQENKALDLFRTIDDRWNQDKKKSMNKVDRELKKLQCNVNYDTPNSKFGRKMREGGGTLQIFQ